MALQYISRQKAHNSRFFELSVQISKYENLQVIYLPGEFLFRTDSFSRQWDKVFLRNPTKMSEKFSRMIPPIPKNLRNKLMKLTTAQLQSFMLNERPPEILDLSEKRQFYKQQVTTADLNQALKSVMDTELLFAFLREGFNSKEMLQLPLLRNLLKDVSKQTKQSFEELI